MREIALGDLANQADYDAVIVGAGMVGLSLACGLSELFARILVIDAFAFRNDPQPATRSFDERSTALSWSSVEILQRLGIWQGCVDAAQEIKRVHVSERGRMGVTELTAADSPVEKLGYVLPNRALGAALVERLQSVSLDILSPCQVAAVDQCEQGMTLRLENESGVAECHTSLLLIADGSDSATAKLLGIDTASHDYHQQALICNVATSLPNQGVAYERFTHTGPLAMLPLAAKVSALVWTLPPELARQQLAMSERAFLNSLQEWFGDRLGMLEDCSQRRTYPLRLLQAKELSRRHCFVLGNAAQSLHPVAGQGFNLALRGVVHLLAGLHDAVSSDTPIGDAAMLAGIADAYRADQRQTIFMSDQLIKTFGTSSVLMGGLRDLGLVVLNNMPALKGWFAQQSMGLGHPLPLNRLGRA